MKDKDNKNRLVIYQGPAGDVEVRLDSSQETVLLTQQQVAQLFNVQKAAISKHVNNIFNSRELDKNSTVSVLETVQTEGKRHILRKIEYYNLDLVLSIGYRVNSLSATKFRQWATKTLRKHIIKGYTINRKRIAKNYGSFMTAVEGVRALLPPGSQVDSASILELIKLFAGTWFSLAAYDKGSFGKGKITRKRVVLAAADLAGGIAELKAQLLKKGEASDLFALERAGSSLEGIVGNVMQTFDGKDLYPSTEEKAAHLLYFIIKSHPFADGNKRSGAFALSGF
ncbi:MAG: virulence protein RhuM/Fic/DOC family protein [Candidatus Margulisiibacteriota bacterium]